MIEVDLALLADAANVSSDGKLNVLGEFNLLLAEQPPWTMVGRSLVVRFTGHAGDAGQHTLGLRLLDQDRSLVWAAADSAMDFPRSRLPGTPARVAAITELPPIICPSEGGHQLEILVDGEVRGCIDLYCIFRKDMPGRAGG